jgi:hypothetical protein
MTMKKTGIMVMVIIFMLGILPTSSSAFTLPLRVEVNGEKIIFPDAQAFVDKNNRVQVPVRFVSEALGAKVEWTAKTKTVGVAHDVNKIKLTVGNKLFYVNGQKKQMDTAAITKEGRTFVPLRFVSEALGAQVNWDSAINTVEITTGGEVVAGTGTGTDPKNELEDEQVSQGENPENGEIIKSHGFTFYSYYGSKLQVTKGHYDELGKEYVIFQMLTGFDDIAGDYNQQLIVVEKILLQKINKSTVDSIMKYVKVKKVREDELQSKEFNDDTYLIIVMSGYNRGVNIKIFYK